MERNIIPITDLKGIGEKTANYYKKLNIHTLEDLMEYYPRDYISYPGIKAVSDLKEGETAAVLGKVCDDFFQRKTANNVITTVSARDSSGRIHFVFFHLAYLRNVLKFQSEYVFYGKVVRKGREWGMEQPAIIKPADYEVLTRTLQPVYSLTKGITSKNISNQVKKVLREYGDIPETIPEEVIRKYSLVDRKTALMGIHFPKDEEDYFLARRRLCFEEFYDFFIKLKMRIQERKGKKSAYPMIETAECGRFMEQLPYELTGAQKRTFAEIRDDLCSGSIMNRLVQGDVGSGKTILAFLAMLLCASNSFQCALMAPTEVLAVQHYRELADFTLKYKLPFRLGLLTGSTKAKDRREILESLKSGSMNAIIGTHAIFQEDVVFDKLGLVITDEQHRFGVKQRDQLKEKGGEPHVLVMSATPIPRTLAGALYGDLDVSNVDEMPSNRLKVKSVLITKDKRKSAYYHILSQLKEGRQAYVICPMIEGNEMTELENVSEYARALREEFPETVQIGVLHGRMKDSEKNRIMGMFAEHQIDLLVSTTVIEVGINVANATVIMIENAERFGLAALHQLRGRVGRGQYQSYCIFVSAKEDENTSSRLKVLIDSTDGFHIANEDLRLRGPGDALGVRQSGQMLFKIGDIYRDQELVMQAKEAAWS